MLQHTVGTWAGVLATLSFFFCFAFNLFLSSRGLTDPIYLFAHISASVGLAGGYYQFGLYL